MIVLSLFDGISGARLACERAGIKVDKYYASEIDKYAIEVSKKNFPDIIQLGDITKWKEWKIEQPDLIIGGSPCQGFSFAGKQLNFEDERSKLFFVFNNILCHYQPKNFLLENVKMKKEYQDVITDFLGVKPVLLNSSLLSAQNRERLYWNNVKIIHPEDKGILLKDIVFDDSIFTYLRPRGNNPGGLRSISGKVGTVTSNSWEHNNFVVCMHNLYGGFGETKHRTFIDKSPTIRTAAGGGHIPSLLLSEKALEYMDREVKGGRTHWDFQHHSDVNKPKSAAVVANFFKGVPYNVLKDWNCIRYFDPIEVERLQTYPDNYTEGISKTQRYKALGNSFTVDVIAHILNSIKESENG
jgi:DNA-cytosine methyltransferase